MSNPSPSTPSQITTLAGKNIAGLTVLGTDLGITQITAGGLQALLDSYTSADNIFNQARSVLSSAYDEFHTADAELSEWLRKTRAVFTIAFGSRWNTQWAQAGYATPSTALPTTIDGRMGLALRVIGFLTANPGYENAPAGVTAATGTAIRSSAVGSQQAVGSATTVSQQTMDNRTAAGVPLMAKMRLLVAILTDLLAADSPMWATFGLNAPANDVTPGKPQNLSAGLDPDGDVLVQCDAVALATRYRWRTRPAGSTEPYVLAASTVEPMACLTEVEPGSTIEIIVQAVNVNSQGVASDPVVFANPALAKVAEPMVPTPEIAPKTNGNGHSRNGNGHALTARA